MRWKGTRPLLPHPSPSSNETRKCQGCARSKLSGIPPAAQPPARQFSDRALFVGVVLGFQPFQERLKKGFRRVARPADGLRHFLRCRWKISFIRVDSCKRQVADPVARIFLWNLGIQLEGAL